MLEKKGIKKLITIGVTFIIIIVLILGGAFLYNKFLHSKSYSEIETIMANAAKNYFNVYEEKLPKTVNNSVTITSETLIKQGRMESFANYLKKEKTSCTGKVVVTNITGKKYRYAAMLDCGKDYKTKTLNDYINSNVNIVTSGDGLYKLNNSLVYRGENVDNYIKLNGNLYRIVKFVNGHPVIILTEITENIIWDNRYNIVNDQNTGINNYDVSRIQHYLHEMYKSNEEDALFKDSTRLLITSHDVAIGKRSNANTNKSGSLENAVILSNQYISLLPANDFLNASLDENCTTTVSKSCSNYNYLNKYKYTWWTATAKSKSTYKVYVVDKDTKILKTAWANNKAYVRPVIHLATDVIYISGNGSKETPYRIK